MCIRRAIFGLLLSLLLISGATNARAFTLSTGEIKPCIVQTAHGPYTVPEVVGWAKGFAAYTELMPPYGLPIITFDHPKVVTLTTTPIVVDFLFYHECAHARFGTRFYNSYVSELGANCEGLRRMRADGKISPAQESVLANFHITTNVYGQLFGNGSNYWNLTLDCASKPPAFPESNYLSPGG